MEKLFSGRSKYFSDKSSALCNMGPYCRALLLWNCDIAPCITVSEYNRGLYSDPIYSPCKKVPQNALIMPSLQRYVRYLSNHELKNQRIPSLYYVDSKIPYYIPVSVRNAVVSLALENRLTQDGERLLIKGVSKDAYIPKVIISRKAALLSLAGYAIVIRIMELWAIFFAVAVKAIMALAMLIASGALFGNIEDIKNAFSFGFSLGSVMLKINEIAGYIQDKLIDLVMKITCSNSYRIIEESNQI